MIIGKTSNTVNDKNPLSRSALRRKDLHRGRQVLVYDMKKGVIMDATIMSSPFNEMPDRPNHQGTNILVQNNDFDHINAHSLYALGVTPDVSGAWSAERYLLDTNRYNNQQLREDGSDPYDPPDRS